MSAAVGKYGGDPFPAAPDKLVRGAQVTVPDLAGKSPDEAKSILNGLGLDSTDGGAQDSAAPAGTVASSNPAAGSSVGKGTVVTLYTSNGSLVAIPNVVGQKLSDAQHALAAAGFSAKVNGGGASATDIVQAMDPGAGTPAKAGTQVTLTLQKATPTPGLGAGG